MITIDTSFTPRQSVRYATAAVLSGQAAPLGRHCCYVKENSEKGARFGHGYAICSLRYDRVKPMHNRNSSHQSMKTKAQDAQCCVGCCVHSGSQAGMHSVQRWSWCVCGAVSCLPFMMCSFSGIVLHRRPAAFSPPSSVAAETDPSTGWMTGGQAGSEH